MIIIKIKTWKDYKKDFINWVQAPRRKTCKEFVKYMGSVSQKVVDKRLAEELDKIEFLNEAQKKTSFTPHNKPLWIAKKVLAS